jgi:hydroxyacylglutathione hydrolase
MSLSVTQLAVGGYDDNFAYLIEVDTGQCAVVDPSGDADVILQTISERQLQPICCFITHTHHDHIDALGELLRAYAVPIYVHEKGQGNIISPGPVQTIADDTMLDFVGHPIDIRYTPGHADDALSFFITGNLTADGVPKVITGDTLFVGGCGRTTADRVKDLYESLQELKTLPDDTIIYPGHDYGQTPTSTIGHEKTTNRFFLAKDFSTFTTERLGT